jgi:hypothetical protein
MFENNEDGIYLLRANTWMKNCTFANNSQGIYGFSEASVTVKSSYFADHEDNAINLQDSSASIKTTLFLNNSYALRAVRTSISLEGDEFRLGEIGVNLEDGTLNVKDCRFDDINRTGIKGFSASVLVGNSEFVENRNGIEVDGVAITVYESEFLDNNETGLFIENSDLTVRDTRIIGNMDGLLDMGHSHLHIEDCNISSNQMYGVYTDHTTHVFNFTVTRKIILQDNPFQLHGDLIIEDGGELTLLRATLVFHANLSGEVGLIVKTGGKLSMIESLTRAVDDQVGYTFMAESGSSISIVNCTLRHIGRGLTGDNSGLVVRTLYATIYDTLFENNSIGLVVIGTTFEGHDIRFKDNRIGFYVNNGDIDLVNSSVEGSTLSDLRLNIATARLLNTRISYSKADVQDEGSILIVRWYLHISVIWDDGQPVDQATVEVEDKGGGTLTSTTDSQGFVRWLIVSEYQQKGPDATGYLPFSPHDITVRERDLVVTRSEYIGTTMTVIVTLMDQTPPVVKITDPDSGTAHYDTELLVMGWATDEASEVVSVEVSIDGKNWILANGTRYWFANLTVPDGNHTIHAKATDARGNVGATTIYIVVDLESPLLVITSPRNGLITNASSVMVYGKVHAGSSLVINDDPVTVEQDGTFQYNLFLSEGENFVHAKALAKNGLETMESDIVVIGDTTRPEIILIRPTPGSYINSSIVTISVTSNEVATFTVNNVSVETYGGVADINIELAEGVNTISITAVDIAGNSNRTAFKVILDTVRPDLEIVKPLSPAFSTTKEKITIMGRTEPGANLTINGEPVDIEANGNFTVKVKLKYGKNTIKIVSRDVANNTNEMTLEVKRNQVEDTVNYMWLAILAVIVVVAVDVAILVFFSRYYKPKRGGGAAGDEEEDEAEYLKDEEDEDLEDGPEDEPVIERPMPASRRKIPRARARQVSPKVEEETEFEEFEDEDEDMDEF